MRALALIIAAALPLASCDGDDSNGFPPENAVEVGPCVGAPNSLECRKSEAEDACTESADKDVCVENYLENYPATQPATGTAADA